ncbi:MAG: outer membrane protein assembly factor BamC [Burkholderiaceae bacterium]|nr:outer membrane protein assembly factor BamC [Burkholderiaceae bacterium]
MAAAATLSGCANGFLSGEKVDYRAGARQTKGLDVPPDLTQLAREGRYQAPAPVVSASGTTASPAAASTTPSVAPSTVGGIRMLRDGDLRWLQLPMPPEQVWPQLRQFWLDSGFTLEVDDPAAGVLETAWSENRAKLPQDGVRRLLGGVLDSLFDSGERDRFRARLERTPTGSEVYISHRGAQQVISGAQRDDVRWTLRPTDPQLEAELLSRLMVRMGSSIEQAQAAAGQAAVAAAPARARLVADAATPSVEVDEAFERAWRRVGLALDRSGFTVEDRNRTDGVYFVRYVDSQAPDERGFFSRLFGAEEARQAQRYRIALVGGAAGATPTVVAVQTAEGQPITAPVGGRIANVLLRELR